MKTEYLEKKGKSNVTEGRGARWTWAGLLRKSCVTLTERKKKKEWRFRKSPNPRKSQLLSPREGTKRQSEGEGPRKIVEQDEWVITISKYLKIVGHCVGRVQVKPQKSKSKKLTALGRLQVRGKRKGDTSKMA